MSNPTSSFGWQMPTPTDLVTDLPADFEVFGQAVDTSMADLLGGTAGQILAKNSNTNMDFVWITNDVGDITAVNTTAPLQGGGTSGALTLSIDSASTTVVGAVQLEDSTASTSTTKAATPNSVKTAYDLANGAIAKSTVTTTGDIIYRNATVPVRLGIGSTGQVLTVASGIPSWATPAVTNGPAFSATKTGTQTITAATWTKVAFNVETFDTNSCYDPTTNYRFTPTTAGIYSMNTTIEMSSSGGSYFYMQFYKNGAGFQTLTKQGSFTDFLQSGSSLVSMNGTTDYLEVYVYASGTSPQIDAGACLFGGVWIRSN